LLAENTSCSLGELIHQRFLVLGEFDLSPIAREPIHDRIIQVFMNLISNALDALVDLKSHPDLIEQRDHLIPKDALRTEHSNVQTDCDRLI
jgi:signal transduction histidine kinase